VKTRSYGNKFFGVKFTEFLGSPSYTLRNDPEDRVSLLPRGGSLKSRKRESLTHATGPSHYFVTLLLVRRIEMSGTPKIWCLLFDVVKQNMWTYSLHFLYYVIICRGGAVG
jgi:hypothetical protein